MSINVDEQPDFAELIKRSKTKSNRLFFIVIVLTSILLITIFPRIVSAYRDSVNDTVAMQNLEKQVTLWRRNASCLPEKITDSNSVLMQNGDKASAKICPSGDLLIWVVTKDNVQSFKWIPRKEFYPERPGRPS